MSSNNCPLFTTGYTIPHFHYGKPVEFEVNLYPVSYSPFSSLPPTPIPIVSRSTSSGVYHSRTDEKAELKKKLSESERKLIKLEIADLQRRLAELEGRKY
jgi:hypothetical protein